MWNMGRILIAAACVVVALGEPSRTALMEPGTRIQGCHGHGHTPFLLAQARGATGLSNHTSPAPPPAWAQWGGGSSRCLQRSMDSMRGMRRLGRCRVGIRYALSLYGGEGGSAGSSGETRGWGWLSRLGDWRLRPRGKRQVQVSAGRGKGGGRAAKDAEVRYMTAVGWLKQDSLTGQERINGYSSDSNPDESEETLEGDGEVGPRRFRYACTVLYDGSPYCGWQLQPHQPSVQGLLETVLAKKLQHKVKVVGAGRTDTGVHARGQVAHFETESEIDCDRFQHSFNRMLPFDVRIKDLQAAPKSRYVGEDGRELPWHSIYNALGKLYVYRIYSGPILDPLQRHMRHFEHRTLDDDRLRAACREFVGTHDFAAFANKNVKGKAGRNAVRTIHSIQVHDEGGGEYRVEFLLDGALYKMVRNIMGTVLAVACGKLEASSIAAMFEEGSRQRVPTAAPAHGLCLEQVYFAEFGDTDLPECFRGKRKLPPGAAMDDG